MAIIRINLLPPKVKQARQRRLMITGAVIAGCAFLTLPAGLWYLKWQRVESLKAEIARIDRESGRYGDVIKKVKDLQDSEDALVKQLDVVDKLTARQALWIKLLEAIGDAQSHAQDLWLVHLDSRALTGPDAGKIELNLRGNAFSIASVEDFARNLKGNDFSPQVFPPTFVSQDVFGQPTISFTMKIWVKG